MTAAGGRHRVAVLVLPGVLPLEFGIAAQVFGTDPHYDLLVCAASQACGVPEVCVACELQR